MNKIEVAECPICGSFQISTEKRLNGNSFCICGHSAKTSEFFKKKIVHPEHAEAINIIRTIRCMIDYDFNDKRFKQHVLSLLHSTGRGCIGRDKDIPEELIKYDLPKEWE